jgi:hypothetical protein
MPTRQRKPATVTGPIPFAPPAASKYCMHAVPPPTNMHAPAPVVASVPDALEPACGLPADIILDEVAYMTDPDNEPF